MRLSEEAEVNACAYSKVGRSKCGERKKMEGKRVSEQVREREGGRGEREEMGVSV